MSSDIKLKAKQALQKRKGANTSTPLKGTSHQATPRLVQPKIADYSKIHPEVLEHVSRYLDEFKRGLGNGRR